MRIAATEHSRNLRDPMRFTQQRDVAVRLYELAEGKENTKRNALIAALYLL